MRILASSELIDLTIEKHLALNPELRNLLDTIGKRKFIETADALQETEDGRHWVFDPVWSLVQKSVPEDLLALVNLEALMSLTTAVKEALRLMKISLGDSAATVSQGGTILVLHSHCTENGTRLLPMARTLV